MNKLMTVALAGISCAGGLSFAPLAFAQPAPRFACSTAQDATIIRDYATFTPVAKLKRGECIEVAPDPDNGSPVRYKVYRGEVYYVTVGVSGNLRLVSSRYTRLK